MKKILLLFDKDFKIDKHGIEDFLNSNTEFLEFKVYRDDIAFDGNILTKPKSFDCVAGQLIDPFKEFDRVFCFTNRAYDDNYFFHELNFVSIYSFYGWSYLTDLPKNNGLLYFIISYLAINIDSSGYRHDKETGCIYDFHWLKAGIDDGMRQSKICPACLKRVNEQRLSDVQSKILEDLKKLMNLLSNASKWNKDIFDTPNNNMGKIAKRHSKREGEINVVIASPGDTQAERKLLLDSLEIQFRRGNHETHCAKRLIVHGWEDLASQNGYPQDVINEKIIREMDFVIAIFKHKLGTETEYPNSGKKRAESGTAEELLQTLNYATKGHPLGMAYFFSKAPVVSLDSPELDKMVDNWENLEAFKKKIQKKMIYKPYNECDDLLQTILIDLEKNIIDNFIK